MSPVQVWVAPCIHTESFPLYPSEFLGKPSLLRQRGQALEAYLHHSSLLGEEARPYSPLPAAISLAFIWSHVPLKFTELQEMLWGCLILTSVFEARDHQAACFAPS